MGYVNVDVMHQWGKQHRYSLCKAKARNYKHPPDKEDEEDQEEDVGAAPLIPCFHGHGPLHARTARQ
jgi:hypothetical protein